MRAIMTKYKILVIEDDPDQSKPFVQLLRYRGYEVVTAQNGIDGVAKAEKEKPHLIIVDLLLVEHGDTMDGYEVIRSLRSNPNNSKSAIMAWTGHFVRTVDEIQALRAGADIFAQKDLEFGVLEARIEAVLRSVIRFSNND
jgi:two-component system, OmpR family, alkaline phosphatase synthesis response regulator PhoP